LPPAPSAGGAPEPAPPTTETSAGRLGSILEGLETEEQSAAAPLPTATEIRAQRLAAQRKADADLKTKAAKGAEAAAVKEAEAKKIADDAAKAKANPARLWVQIATGANRSGLPITWRKLKAEAPKVLADRSAWYAPFRNTNRLLVGPIKSNSDARSLVASLGKAGVQATVFSSEAGLEVNRLGGK
jgi:SPOR domain